MRVNGSFLRVTKDTLSCPVFRWGRDDLNLLVLCNSFIVQCSEIAVLREIAESNGVALLTDVFVGCKGRIA